MVNITLQINPEHGERTPPICHSIKGCINKHLVIIVLVCLLAMPIAATIIYIRFRGDLDKCVGFEGWMLSFIIIGFITIVGTIIERYRNDNKHCYIMPCCSLVSIGILWSLACVLLLDSNNADVCSKVSPHVYNFIFSVVVIPPGIIVIMIVILILACICMCIVHIFNC